MNKRTFMLSLLFFGICFMGLPAFGGSRDKSNLGVAIHTGANLAANVLLIDTHGNMTGFNPDTNSEVRQIPESGFAVDDIPGTPPTLQLMVGSPENGKYVLKVIGTATAPYTLAIYMADKYGKSQNVVLKGILTENRISEYVITYSNIPGEPSGITKLVTPSGVKEDIALARKIGWIDNDGIMNSLFAKLNQAEEAINKGKSKQAKNVLEAFINEVKAQEGKHINAEFVNQLIEDARYIIEHI